MKLNFGSGTHEKEYVAEVTGFERIRKCHQISRGRGAMQTVTSVADER